MTHTIKVVSLIFILSTVFISPTLAKDDEFDLFIVPTLDNQLDSWLKMPPNLQPTIHLVNRIYPNQPFALRLLFKGYSISTLKNAHLTYDVQFFAPDQKPTEDRGKNLLGYNGPVKSTNYIIINQQLLRVFFDKNYTAGDYDIQVTATDQIANKVISKTGTIAFAPFERSGSFASFEFFNSWLQNYFRQPDAAKATFGVLQFLKNDQQWLQENIRLLAFIDQLLNDNPWIWDHLTRVYRENEADRKGIITLMALNNHQIPELTQDFTKEQKAWFEKVRGFDLPSTDELISTPEQIEALWGAFYATGHLKPIEQIVRLLKPFALSNPPTEGVLPKEIEQAAFWSLVNNAMDIPLATNYSLYLLDHGQFAPENKIQLKLAIGVIKKALEEEQAEQQPPDKKTPLPLVK